MSFENFEEYLTSKVKISDESKFKEKLESLLSKDKTKIDKKKKEEEENEKIYNQRLKDVSNEKKIDFILSDEISFEQFKNKNTDFNQIKEEEEMNFDDIIYNMKNASANAHKEISSNITNTDNLINKEKDKNDIELAKLEEDIKNNNPLIYNWQKIKKYKEVKDLQVGLEKDEVSKEINTKNAKNKNLNKSAKTIANNEIISDKKDIIKFETVRNKNININITNKSYKSLNAKNNNNNINKNINNKLNNNNKNQEINKGKKINEKSKDKSKDKKLNNSKKNLEVNKEKQTQINKKDNENNNDIKSYNDKDNEDDLIMSMVQRPIQACQKTKIRKNKKLQNNLIIKEEKEKENINNYNISKDINYNNNNNDNLISLKNNKNSNSKLNTSNMNKKMKEEETLLNIFKKEKEIKNKLNNILLNNPSVSKNDFFSNNDFDKNKFYNYNSNSKFLSMAKEILINKLTAGEKNYIMEIEEETNNIKQRISDTILEKNKYNKLVSEKKKELNDLESKLNKDEFDFERELMNDLRSIVNKFKIELYRKELELNKSNNDDNNDNDDSDSNKEVEMLRKEYNKVKNKLDLINKNNEKNIIEMQKKIMIQNYENEKMKEKIDMYEQDNKIENLEEELPKNSKKTLLNKPIKKEKKIKLVNDDDDDDNIIINNSNYTMNNIIKTSSKSNHINELDLEFPKKYFDENNENHKIIKHQFELDGKTIKIFNSGKKEIIFPNATKKEIFPDGYTLVSYSNGDIKETIPNYKEIYYYKKDEVNQIVFSDGDKYIKYLKTGIVISNGNLVN